MTGTTPPPPVTDTTDVVADAHATTPAAGADATSSPSYASEFVIPPLHQEEPSATQSPSTATTSATSSSAFPTPSPADPSIELPQPSSSPSNADLPPVATGDDPSLSLPAASSPSIPVNTNPDNSASPATTTPATDPAPTPAATDDQQPERPVSPEYPESEPPEYFDSEKVSNNIYMRLLGKLRRRYIMPMLVWMPGVILLTVLGVLRNNAASSTSMVIYSIMVSIFTCSGVWLYFVYRAKVRRLNAVYAAGLLADTPSEELVALIYQNRILRPAPLYDADAMRWDEPLPFYGRVRHPVSVSPTTVTTTVEEEQQQQQQQQERIVTTLPRDTGDEDDAVVLDVADVANALRRTCYPPPAPAPTPAKPTAPAPTPSTSAASSVLGLPTTATLSTSPLASADLSRDASGSSSSSAPGTSSGSTTVVADPTPAPPRAAVEALKGEPEDDDIDTERGRTRGRAGPNATIEMRPLDGATTERRRTRSRTPAGGIAPLNDVEPRRRRTRSRTPVGIAMDGTARRRTRSRTPVGIRIGEPRDRPLSGGQGVPGQVAIPAPAATGGPSRRANIRLVGNPTRARSPRRQRNQVGDTVIVSVEDGVSVVVGENERNISVVELPLSGEAVVVGGDDGGRKKQRIRKNLVDGIIGVVAGPVRIGEARIDESRFESVRREQMRAQLREHFILQELLERREANRRAALRDPATDRTPGSSSAATTPLPSTVPPTAASFHHPSHTPVPPASLPTAASPATLDPRASSSFDDTSTAVAATPAPVPGTTPTMRAGSVAATTVGGSAMYAASIASEETGAGAGGAGVPGKGFGEAIREEEDEGREEGVREVVV
ncbi:hypothetical protein HDU96_003959 [Phlyctochytrium bullatum]|nr:hypothetical protein HDU96_003959 [Phlyctochytrium bullatum]